MLFEAMESSFISGAPLTSDTSRSFPSEVVVRAFLHRSNGDAMLFLVKKIKNNMPARKEKAERAINSHNSFVDCEIIFEKSRYLT